MSWKSPPSFALPAFSAAAALANALAISRLSFPIQLHYPARLKHLLLLLGFDGCGAVVDNWQHLPPRFLTKVASTENAHLHPARPVVEARVDEAHMQWNWLLGGTES
ncbi:hypothetical protein BDK51DRAFT_34334 [Blyttiomyces helicus]|uniref:Uncharacterized protein n=1 Tax=Blyttiomyces helicus TaxID=388810 RepID=A0A4P9WAZ8_9FUNG|nr:hypothetical protein BDK51DRAFT_34334 [Blyttiomyces helicus]|eukprot:RKO89644.1 hypothetical protein BDK51DRAFT_34334 [Blyttiomyces helicus]